MLQNPDDLSCLLIDDLYQALEEQFHIFFLKSPAPRLTGKILSSEYGAVGAVSLKVKDNYYYVVVTRVKHSIKMFSLKELLQEFSIAAHNCIFLSISMPEPVCFLSIDLFFCGGCVYSTPTHWDYCLPTYNIPTVYERSYQLKQQDFVLLEDYFKAN